MASFYYIYDLYERNLQESLSKEILTGITITEGVAPSQEQNQNQPQKQEQAQTQNQAANPNQAQQQQGATAQDNTTLAATGATNQPATTKPDPTTPQPTSPVEQTTTTPMVVLLDSDNPEVITLPTQEENKDLQPINKYYVANNGIEYETIGIINIDKINIKYPILANTTDELLEVSVCKFYGASPNEIGNCCIVGHNYRNNQFFSNIDKLKVDDIINITDLTGRTVSYAVLSKYTVGPNDVECTNQLTAGKRKLTLITCTDNNKKRVIVEAEEIKG